MDILQKRTWAQIDLDAAAHNFKEIRRYVGNRSMVCCVIKADAYGHGAVRMAEEYEALGADWLALSNIEEALQVRRAGIKLPLLVLGYTPAEAADVLAENDIAQCAYSAEYCAALSENAVKSGVKVKIHVKVDTGMSRLGFYFQDIERDKEAVSVVAEACRRPGLIPEGIFTHFAVADGGENGKAFTLKQFSCFMALIAELEKPGRDPRDELPSPILRSDIKDMKDLKPGMEMRGTVRNVIDFGAFVDIGVHQDGLVHITQISDKFVRHRRCLKVATL